MPRTVAMLVQFIIICSGTSTHITPGIGELCVFKLEGVSNAQVKHEIRWRCDELRDFVIDGVESSLCISKLTQECYQKSLNSIDIVLGAVMDVGIALPVRIALHVEHLPRSKRVIDLAVLVLRSP